VPGHLRAAPPRSAARRWRHRRYGPGIPPQPAGARGHPLHVRAAYVLGCLVGGHHGAAAQPNLVDQDRAARDALFLFGPLVDQSQGRQFPLPRAAADPRPGRWPRRRHASQSSRSSGSASCQYLPRCDLIHTTQRCRQHDLLQHREFPGKDSDRPCRTLLLKTSLTSKTATSSHGCPELRRERQADTTGLRGPLSVDSSVFAARSVAVRAKPTVPRTAPWSRFWSAMRPWTPQRNALQRPKVTHLGTK